MTARDIPDNWSLDRAEEQIEPQPNYIPNNQTTDTTAVCSHFKSVKNGKNQDGSELSINNASKGTFNLRVIT
ncbi:MAG: chromosome segregation ATPase, partial [Dolichospermum sp.]